MGAGHFNLLAYGKQIMTILRAPDGTESCTVAGVVYLVEHGLVDLPDHAFATLESHGFTVHNAEVTQQEEPPENPVQSPAVTPPPVVPAAAPVVQQPWAPAPKAPKTPKAT